MTDSFKQKILTALGGALYMSYIKIVGDNEMKRQAHNKLQAARHDLPDGFDRIGMYVQRKGGPLRLVLSPAKRDENTLADCVATLISRGDIIAGDVVYQFHDKNPQWQQVCKIAIWPGDEQ